MYLISTLCKFQELFNRQFLFYHKCQHLCNVQGFIDNIEKNADSHSIRHRKQVKQQSHRRK